MIQHDKIDVVTGIHKDKWAGEAHKYAGALAAHCPTKVDFYIGTSDYSDGIMESIDEEPFANYIVHWTDIIDDTGNTLIFFPGWHVSFTPWAMRLVHYEKIVIVDLYSANGKKKDICIFDPRKAGDLCLVHYSRFRRCNNRRFSLYDSMDTATIEREFMKKRVECS